MTDSSFCRKSSSCWSYRWITYCLNSFCEEIKQGDQFQHDQVMLLQTKTVNNQRLLYCLYNVLCVKKYQKEFKMVLNSMHWPSIDYVVQWIPQKTGDHVSPCGASVRMQEAFQWQNLATIKGTSEKSQQWMVLFTLLYCLPCFWSVVHVHHVCKSGFKSVSIAVGALKFNAANSEN